MGPIDLLNHLLNFVLPAAFVALALAWGGRWVARSPGAPRWWVLAAIHFAVGVAALAAGLVYFGNDGKMATYVALVLACASSHWVAVRAWRR